MKWYEQKYVNRRDWILDNLENLKLSPQELTVVMTIDFYNENRTDISMDILQKKTGLDMDELNRVVSVLCARHYLDIMASSRNVQFRLDGLFDTDTAKDIRVMDSPLIELFEEEFGRPMTPNEMQKISEWNRIYPRKTIIHALREASAYQKRSMSYVESVLRNTGRKGQ
ncbi:MAG: DnaD domain protein [Erysipelotrichaceae bacterium]|nr:DnaD domain protein [Erysipelotrichaceae bacterium]MBR2727170.1 DnaD domain protein [Solobacterium sp.]MCR5373668.1 DnaD domain protein [Solobacterium sp.]